MSFRDYPFTDEALAQAKDLGLSLDEVRARVRLSVRFTHPKANYRHEDLLFLIQAAAVVAVFTHNAPIALPAADPPAADKDGRPDRNGYARAWASANKRD